MPSVTSALTAGLKASDSRQGVGNLLKGKSPRTDTPCACCKLSAEQRIYGFGFCFIVGCFMIVLALFMLFSPTKFAILYSLGNISALGSTLFLIGPARQLKLMFARKRIVATIAFIVSIILTLVVAFAFGGKPFSVVLVIIFIVIQVLSLIWYSASYIPFAQDALKRCAGGCCNV